MTGDAVEAQRGAAADVAEVRRELELRIDRFRDRLQPATRLEPGQVGAHRLLRMRHFGENRAMPELYRFRAGGTPLLVSMPHTGTHLPEWLEPRLARAAKALPDT